MCFEIAWLCFRFTTKCWLNFPIVSLWFDCFGDKLIWLLLYILFWMHIYKFRKWKFNYKNKRWHYNLSKSCRLFKFAHWYWFHKPTCNQLRLSKLVCYRHKWFYWDFLTFITNWVSCDSMYLKGAWMCHSISRFTKFNSR